MPYLNPSWWVVDAPTLLGLPAPLRARDLAVQDAAGQPALERYGDREGFLVSAFPAPVRERFAALMEEWGRTAPSDCVFFDQFGARTWRRDFNPASPDPLAYYDGWLGLLAPYAGRCLMVEDGWDRLAESSVGFHGSLLMMARESDEPDFYWGAGNWEPYPLATWLFHDKVLHYQHDLYPGTMTADAEALTWNLAFGMMLSATWDTPAERLGDPWLDLAGSVQRALGPHYAGRPLVGYRTLTPTVTQTTFDRLSVIANRGRQSHGVEGYGIAPDGFLARTPDGSVVAGAFEGTFAGAPLAPGVHYLIVRREPDAVTVEQPVGPPTPVVVPAPAALPPAEALRATALAADGTPLGAVEGELRGGRFAFTYGREMAGARVAAYRIAAG
jgi:hypothetical protein